MTFKPIINDKIITIVGAVFLGSLLLSAWLPQPCPLLKNKIVGCPSPKSTVHLTPHQQEIADVAHQNISASYGFFKVKSEPQRDSTTVNFEYRQEKPVSTVYLQIKDGSAYRDLALVTTPLLNGLPWPSISEENNHLYQKNGTFSSINDFLTNLPSANQVIADKLEAATYHLEPSQYTNLESIDSLSGFNYVLTSYGRTYQEKGWNFLSETFDLSSIIPDKDGNIEGGVYFTISPTIANPFLLGTVHVNYGLADHL